MTTSDVFGSNDLLSGNLVSRSDAAKLLGVSVRTLDRWHALREGPPRISHGKTIRYRRTAIHQWLIEHEICPQRCGCLSSTRRGSAVSGCRRLACLRIVHILLERDAADTMPLPEAPCAALLDA